MLGLKSNFEMNQNEHQQSSKESSINYKVYDSFLIVESILTLDKSKKQLINQIGNCYSKI